MIEKKLDECKISNRKQIKNSCPLQKQYQLNERQRNECEANERLNTTQTYDDLICWFVTFLQFYEVIQRPSYVKEGNVDPGWGDGDGVPGGFALKSKAWFTMRHKHKHKYKHKHNACSHLLHKH